MSSILVSGLINLETTLRVDQFPLDYSPVNYPFFGVRSTMSGVGLNISLALKQLGDQPVFLSLVGADMPGRLAMQEISRHGLDTCHVLPQARATAQSVILYDSAGRRQIHVDLKDIQEQVYPPEIYLEELKHACLAVLCNINFSRPMLSAACAAGVPVAVDVHAVSRLDDPYDSGFIAAADILFMSHERLPAELEAWAQHVFEVSPCHILGIGMGSRGALLTVRGRRPVLIPSAEPRPVVNTIGAGDALFASFLHYYLKNGDPEEAMQRAVLFAGFKAGSIGAAEGFLSESDMEVLWASRQRG